MPGCQRLDRRFLRGGGCGRGLRARQRAAAGEQLVDAVDDHLRLERLHQHAVAAGGAGAALVERFEGAGQQQHRDLRQLGIVLDEGGDLVAVALRHADVGQDDVGALGADPLDGLAAVADHDDLDVLVGKGELDDTLDRDAVVGQQKLVGHRTAMPAQRGDAPRPR